MPDSPPLEVFRGIVDHLETGVYVVDRFRKITYWNSGAEKVTGFLAQDVLGRFCRDNILVHCDEQNRQLCWDHCPLAEVVRDGVSREARVYLLHRAGYRVPVRIQAVALRNESGAITGAAELFTICTDLPELPRSEQVLESCGCLDSDTGVPDPRLMESHLRAQLELFAGHRIPFTVMVVRADQLADFGLLHGQDSVNAVLRVVAQTLRHLLRPGDVLGRWGEDRFIGLCPCTRRAPLESALPRIRNLLSCAAVPWWGDRLPVKASVALVTPQAGDTLDSLRQRIDCAFAADPTNKPGDESAGV